MKIEASSRLLAETVNQYIKRLDKLGIKKIGQGGYAKVFQHPTMPDVVVKVMTQYDSGYRKYVAFCQTANNRYCPRILDVVDHAYESDFLGKDKRQLVFMEKLNPLGIASFIRFEYDIDELLDLPQGTVDLTDRRIWKSISRQKKDKDLAQVANFIYTTLTKISGIMLDMHNGNLMVRGNQIVIIDPFAD